FLCSFTYIDISYLYTLSLHDALPILPLQDIAAFSINYLLENYPDSLDERYSLDTTMEDMWDIFVHIGKNRGALESGGTVNFDQVANLVLRDLRTGKLGKITLEKV